MPIVLSSAEKGLGCMNTIASEDRSDLELHVPGRE